MRYSVVIIILCALSLGAGCDSNANTDAGSADAARSGSDSGVDAGGVDSGYPDAAPGDGGSNRFGALCGLPATTGLPDTPPYGRTGYFNYFEGLGTEPETCDIGGGFFDGIPTIRFLYSGTTSVASLTGDWPVQSASGGTIVSGEVQCPDGVEVTIVANSLFDARVLTVTIRFDVGANTVSVLAFNVS